MTRHGGYGVTRRVLFVLGLSAFAAGSAGATSIERVISPAGIEAWLLRPPAVPLVASDFAITGGASEDPADKAGVAHLVASTIDEGAGDLDAKAYHQRLEAHAIEPPFPPTLHSFGGPPRPPSPRRASTTMRSSASARKFSPTCGARPPRPAKSRATCGGTRRSPIIPMAGRRTDRKRTPLNSNH